MSTKIFVTGTDTDVGKTYISAALCLGSQASTPFKYWKPIQTGHPDSDSQTISSVSPKTRILPNSFVYDLPASPDQAALHASKEAPTVEQTVQNLAELDGPLLVEGAGGLKVPFNLQGETWVDFIKASDLTVVLVARTGLGTLNHTSMTLDLLRLHNVTVAGVVISGEQHDDNLQSLRRMHPEVKFHWFPKIDDTSSSEFKKESSSLFQKLEISQEEPQNLMNTDQKYC